MLVFPIIDPQVHVSEVGVFNAVQFCAKSIPTANAPRRGTKRGLPCDFKEPSFSVSSLLPMPHMRFGHGNAPDSWSPRHLETWNSNTEHLYSSSSVIMNRKFFLRLMRCTLGVTVYIVGPNSLAAFITILTFGTKS